MPAPINSPAATAALVNEFDLKGRFRLDLDNVVVPVAVVADVRASAIRGTGFQGSGTSAAAAGEFPALLLGVEPGLQLFPKKLVIASATASLFRIRRGGTNVLATVGGSFGGVSRWSEPDNGPLVASFGSVAGSSGSTIYQGNVEAGVDKVIDLDGWRLGNFRQFLVIVDTANLGVRWSLEYDAQPSND